jgi:hypothetical protein
VRTAGRFGLDQPIYLDNDLAFWKGLGNQVWPAFYLVDRRGRVQLRALGEMHSGEGDAPRFEEALRRLLAES